MNDAKFFRFTLKINNIGDYGRRDVHALFEDLTNEVVNRPSFYHCDFWYKKKSFLITAEYYQSNLKAIFFKLVQNRLDILSESYPYLKISFVIEEVEPDFTSKEHIIDITPTVSKTKKPINDKYTRKQKDERKRAKNNK